jgi:hypothetical protein
MQPTYLIPDSMHNMDGSLNTISLQLIYLTTYRYIAYPQIHCTLCYLFNIYLNAKSLHPILLQDKITVP